MSFTSPIRPQPRAAGEPCSGLFGRASDQVCVANHNCTLQVHVEGCRCFFREFLGVVGTPHSPCSLREKNHTGGELPPEGWKIPGSVCGLCASWRLVADARMCHHGIQRDECTPHTSVSSCTRYCTRRSRSHVTGVPRGRGQPLPRV